MEWFLKRGGGLETALTLEPSPTSDAQLPPASGDAGGSEAFGPGEPISRCGGTDQLFLNGAPIAIAIVARAARV